MVYNTKLFVLNLADTLKCPLIVDVESSMVNKKPSILVPLSSSSSIHKVCQQKIL